MHSGDRKGSPEVDEGGSQQSVLVALDADTGELYEAASLLKLPEEEFSGLRRAAMADRVARRRGKLEFARFTCLLCKQPLYISRRLSSGGNRWFVHERAIGTCPWSAGKRLSPEQYRALIYRGQQEGREHQCIKAFMAQWLEQDPAVCDVRQESVTYGQVLGGEWKRPDVICEFEGKRLVFEIQLSYTFLSEIIRRDDFYRAEGIFIIWVFRELDLRRSYVIDEAFFNRRNIFVLDDAAVQRTRESARLSFTGCFQRPAIEAKAIVDRWQSMPVGLKEVRFPLDSCRPYFFDYERERRALEVELYRRHAAAQWERLRSDVLSAALAYYEGNHESALRTRLDEVILELEESSHWHRGFEPLKDAEFSGWHGVLAVLLSIRHARPIGYSVASTFQVLEAGLRQSIKDPLREPPNDRRYAFAVIYHWAYKPFKPPMTDKNRQWIRRRAQEIHQAVKLGDTRYARVTRYDEVIAMLFPEMEELLSDFGRSKPRVD